MRLFPYLLIALLLAVGANGWGPVLAENGANATTNISATTPLINPLTNGLPGSENRLLPVNYDIWSCDWSPDGKGLVFAGKIQGEDGTKMRVWYWALDPVTDPAPLTNTEQLIDFTPRWAPDGTRLVLTRRSFNNKNSSTTLASALWLKDYPGGRGRQLTHGPEDRDPFWSPDGFQVVFSRGQGPYKAQLISINVKDGLTRVVAGGAGEFLISPWWGRDGKIYFTKLNPAAKSLTVANQNYQVTEFGRGGIWRVDPDGNNLTPVVVDDYDNRQPALAPDGTKLAFVSDRMGTKEGNGKFDRGSLFIKDLASGAVFYVTNKVGLNGGSLSWSPDGKKLAFFTFRSIRPAVWVINLP